MKRWFWGLLPLALVGLLLGTFVRYGPLGVFRASFPPVEELTIDRAVLPQPHRIILEVTNGGPSPVTVAQVMVDDAFWQFSIEPAGKTIPRLGRSKITIPYPWVEGETHEVTLLTSTGLTFSHEIAVATTSPSIDFTYLSTFTLLGVYAGLIPVLLGLLFYPFLRELHRGWLNFFLSLTLGLLAFLVIDTLEEALESARKVASAYQGVALIGCGVAVALLFLSYLSQRQPARADKTTPEGRYWTALMIAVGIGLHNLGEGLAIGSAYAIGEIALGAFLVIGFTLHNLTEGLGIVVPIARDRPRVRTLILLGSIAGLPTVAGTWIGGFTYNPVWTTFFFALGAGAILQVIYEVGRLILEQKSGGNWASSYNVVGFLVGLAIMYTTGLLVVA